MTVNSPYAIVRPKRPAIKLMLYGPAGVGKTRLAATACEHPDMREVLFLNIEGGLLTVADAQLSHPPIAIDIREATQLEEVFWRLAQPQSNDPLAQVHTVVIDSGTELQTLDLEAIIRNKLEREKATSGSSSGKKHSGMDDVWQDDYGENTKRIARWFRWFRDLPVNLVVTAHAHVLLPRQTPGMERKPEEDIRPLEVSPSFTRALRKHVLGYMDSVWYVYASPEGKRKILTQSHGPYYAKTRGEQFSARLGKTVDWPLETPLLAMVYDMLRDPEAPAFGTEGAAEEASDGVR